MKTINWKSFPRRRLPFTHQGSFFTQISRHVFPHCFLDDHSQASQPFQIHHLQNSRSFSYCYLRKKHQLKIIQLQAGATKHQVKNLGFRITAFGITKTLTLGQKKSPSSLNLYLLPNPSSSFPTSITMTVSSVSISTPQPLLTKAALLRLF